MRALCPRPAIALAACLTLCLVAPAGATTITIDPSSQDTFVREDAVNTIPGGGNSWRIKLHSRAARRWRGLVQFDLSSIPQFSTVNSATIRLRETGAALTPTKVHGVYQITGSWLQSTTKWSNQPAHAVGATATATVGIGNATISFGPVTTDVQAWINAPTSNHGWMIIDSAEGDSDDDYVRYVARESRNNTTRKPKLDVDFTAPPCTTNADCVEVPNNLCTMNERCQAGNCAVDPVSCDDANACTDDICLPDQGCLHPIGVCNDGFDCTIDTCDPDTGCTNTPVDSSCTAGGCQDATCVADPDDVTLDDAGCKINSVAVSGSPCVTDGMPCTDDVCAVPTCRNGTNDGAACSVASQCPGGNCEGQCTHPNSSSGTGCPADGNPCTDDVCDGSGVCGVNNTAPCSDGNGCTVGDQCASGSCDPGDPVVCTALDQCHLVGTCDTGSGLCSNPPKGSGQPCDDTNVCTHDDACDGAGACTGIATPKLGCFAPVVAKKAFLLLKDKSPDKKDGLNWKWIKGQATTIADFGTPLTTTGYTLCVFDQSGNPQPRLTVTAPADGICSGKPCWKTTKTGFKYKDKLLDPDGVSSILLKAGAASSSKVLVKGKGDNLPMPSLPLTTPVTVQLIRNDNPSVCWDAKYSTPSKNQSDQFKSSAD